MQNPEDVQLAASALAKRLECALSDTFRPSVAIILGTGLSDAFEKIASPLAAIPFDDLPGFPGAGVASHAGEFMAARLHDTDVLIQKGRYHLYEGYGPEQVCMGVRVMRTLGCRLLVITNAAGSLNPLFPAGGICCLCDLINHTGITPLAGPNHLAWGERFPDMSEAFSKRLISLASESALERKIALCKGVYIGVHGPEMETPAETRMYRQWGADAIGMSTVLEVIAARHLGMECLGLACLTNLNLPDCPQPAPLEAIIETAGKTGPDIALLISDVLEKLQGKCP